MEAITGLIQKGLFGGAFQISLPSSAQDVSLFRQVPDNQEVFVNPSNEQSITIDILEAVTPNDLAAAVVAHFEDTVECNSASSSAVESIEVQSNPDGPPAVLLRGWQKVSKFNQAQEDHVAITIMLYRFLDHSADVLVCFNNPAVSQQQSGTSGFWRDEDVNSCLRSLRLIDPRIFG
ncbi:unnamed protein product [Mesocestoides corti]|uniref:Ran guanine nucleotide release factor n=1 Tax=Mesocestoides corti TaxID=53468 RepID=A0A0R3UMW8_MESCO|nr:unnamed protein product [Mesocestoides corti]